MKIIQSGDVFVKLHRKNLPKMLVLYDGGGKIGYFETWFDNVLLFRPQERFNAKNNSADFVKVAREIASMDNKSISICGDHFWSKEFTGCVKITLSDQTIRHMPLLPDELVILHKKTKKAIEISGFMGDKSISLYHGLPYEVMTSYLHKTHIHTYGSNENSLIDLSDSVIHMDYISDSVWETPYHDVMFYNNIKEELLPFKFPKIILSEQSEKRKINVIINDNFLLPDINSFKELIKSAEESNTYIEFWIRDCVFDIEMGMRDFRCYEKEAIERLRDYVIPKMKFDDYINHLLELYKIAMKHENKKMSTIYRDYDDSYSMYRKIMRRLDECKSNRRFTYLNRYHKKAALESTNAA